MKRPLRHYLIVDHVRRDYAEMVIRTNGTVYYDSPIKTVFDMSRREAARALRLNRNRPGFTLVREV